MPKEPESHPLEVQPLAKNDRKQRRTWSVEEKLRIVKEAEACTERGQIGELLRREGIYSSLLHQWRQQFAQGGRAALGPQKTGRPRRDERDLELEKLRKKNEKLERRLEIAEAVIELQKKTHEILGIALPNQEETESES